MTTRRALILVLALTAINIVTQLILFHHYIDDAVMNSFSADANDAPGYTARAEGIVQHHAFGEIYGSGERLPGYPSFLSVFYFFSDHPLLWARVAQIFLSASVIFCMFVCVHTITRSAAAGLIAGAAVCVWIPFYYFSPIIYAESCSLFLVALLMLSLVRLVKDFRIRDALITGIIVAAIIYFKPNNILLTAPVLLAVWYRYKSSTRAFVRAGVWILVPIVLAVLPWSIFVSSFNDRPILLSTRDGDNLYEGAGLSKRDTDFAVIHYRFSRAHHLTDTLADPDPALAQSAQDNILRQRAIAQWHARTGELMQYDVLKVFHAFGFSFRDKRDAAVACMFLCSLVAAVRLWRNDRRYRIWVLLYAGCFVMTAAQAFVFLANQRYKTVIFDLPALLMIALFADSVLVRRKFIDADNT